MNSVTRPLVKLDQRLEGSVFIGVATSTMQHAKAFRSIASIQRRPGDFGPVLATGTKGYEARQSLLEQFLESHHDFLLYLDGDMLFPVEALERLRAHGLPCVSGLYYRRVWEPTMFPIWFEDDPQFRWPMMFMRELPQTGRMYRLGATGYGCWLIHRSVFEAVAPLLKGEGFILEDDMDVWPYDLAKVLTGEEQLRSLRGTKDIVGSDLRLSFFIRQAGFIIWGDPVISCGHIVDYPLSEDDWKKYGLEWHEDYVESVTAETAAERERRDEERVQ